MKFGDIYMIPSKEIKEFGFTKPEKYFAILSDNMDVKEIIIGGIEENKIGAFNKQVTVESQNGETKAMYWSNILTPVSNDEVKQELINSILYGNLSKESIEKVRQTIKAKIEFSKYIHNR